MKKLIYIILVCLGFYSQAQTNAKFCVDPSYWYVYDWNFTGNPMISPPSYRYEYQKVESDTLYNGRIYQKVYRKTFSTAQSIDPNNFNFYGYYLQDSNKVYLGQDLVNLNLVYDFNLAPGDSFLFNCFSGSSTIAGNYYIKVNIVDSVLYGGSWRKRIIFNSTASTSYINNVIIKWVEGIGDPDFGPMYISVGQVQGLKLTGNIYLSCFSEDFQNVIGTCNFVGLKEITKLEKELLISPQPAADIMYIQSTQLLFRQEDIPIIYDITGKQCAIPMQYINKNTYKLDVSGLSAGMYVIAIKTEKGVVRKKVIVE